MGKPVGWYVQVDDGRSKGQLLCAWFLWRDNCCISIYVHLLQALVSSLGFSTPSTDTPMDLTVAPSLAVHTQQFLATSAQPIRGTPAISPGLRSTADVDLGWSPSAPSSTSALSKRTYQEGGYWWNFSVRVGLVMLHLYIVLLLLVLDVSLSFPYSSCNCKLYLITSRDRTRTL